MVPSEEMKQSSVILVRSEKISHVFFFPVSFPSLAFSFSKILSSILSSVFLRPTSAAEILEGGPGKDEDVEGAVEGAPSFAALRASAFSDIFFDESRAAGRAEITECSLSFTASKKKWSICSHFFVTAASAES